MSKLITSDSEKEKIDKAVKNFESQTSGELVINIASRSDSYFERTYIAVILTVIIFLVGLNVMSAMWLLPTKFSILNYSLVLVFFSAIVFVLFSVFPKLRILLVSEKVEKGMVLKRAMEIFLEQEIFKTENRTGILVYISELEKNVTILADSGINKIVGANKWTEIVDEITQGIKKKNFIPALEEAIINLEKLLLDAGLYSSVNDKNELPDEILNR